MGKKTLLSLTHLQVFSSKLNVNRNLMWTKTTSFLYFHSVNRTEQKSARGVKKNHRMYTARLHRNAFTLTNVFIFFRADFQLAGVTMKSSQTAKSETRVAVTRLGDS